METTQGSFAHAGTQDDARIALLVRFLNNHDVGFGGATVLSATADTITVRCVEYNVDTGDVREVQETIPATMRAVRDWLGY